MTTRNQSKRTSRFRAGRFSRSIIAQTEILLDLIDCAERNFENTGRYLQLWGGLGEIYPEIKFALRRHGTHQAGSGGTINGELVEIKTISPETSRSHVLVKNQGNFQNLLIIRIDREFDFNAKLFDRSELRGGAGKFMTGRLEDNHGT
jgi:hypothetical protein